MRRAYVATGLGFADALAAGSAAAHFEGPVLLVDRDSVPGATAQELARLAPQEIVLAGGTAGVSRTVEEALAQVAPVRRVSGSDRYATAAAIALDAFAGPVPVAYVASGAGFADALAGGPAAARTGAPLLLAAPDSVPSATAEALAALRPQRIVVLGGRAAIGDEVAQGLAAYAPDGVTRIAGSSRYATAAAVAEVFEPGVDVVYLATGTNFPDALAGGPAAAAEGGPLLLVAPDAVPEAAAEALARLRPRALVALGGPGAIGEDVVAAAARAAGL